MTSSAIWSGSEKIGFSKTGRRTERGTKTTFLVILLGQTYSFSKRANSGNILL